MKTIVISANSSNAISHAQDVLRNHGTVAFPTDTVYGLAALAMQAEGIERLFTIKGREHNKAIAVLISDVEMLPEVADHPDQNVIKIAKAFWPGALTIVIPKNEKTPDSLSATNLIGVRIPNHPVALELIRAAGPLAVTSANLSGQANTNNVEEVLKQLDGRIHLVIDGGDTQGGTPSTVVSMIDGELELLREGPISLEQINQVLL